MPSRLQKLCDAIIEATWLAALIVAPLFFDVYSQRVFEPDKISLVRSLALLAVVAWVVKKLDGWRTGAVAPETAAPPLWRQPLVRLVLALAAAYLLSTVLSVNPRTSFWGSYQRLQGAFSMFSYMAFFFVVLDTLRSPEQWRRLQHTVILASVPIALYGILQRAQLDPLPWGGDTFERVASNMGNAIFVAAYLIMTVPLTLERLIVAGQRMVLDKEGSVADALAAGGLFFALVLQLGAIVLTQSRGPWLGLAAGGYVFVLLGLTSLRQRAGDQSPLRAGEAARGIGIGLAGLALAAAGLAATQVWPGIGGVLLLIVAALGALALYLVPIVTRRGWRWLWMSVVTQAIVAMALLIVLNLPSTPLVGVKQIPYVGRLGQMLETEGGTGRVRVLIWQGVVEMMKPHPPLDFPQGRTDALNPIRQLIGYGPESMWVAFNRFYRPELGDLEARNASPDRSHNETFDSLVTTGLLGFIAYILLFSSIFFYALRWLGLIAGRSDRTTFIVLGAVGGVLGVLIPILVGAAHYAGVGVALGFILAVLAYVTYASLRGATGIASFDRRHLLIITLLSTIVAHFVEIHFGIAIVSTRTTFFILTAALVGIGAGGLRLAEASPPLPAAAPPPAVRPAKTGPAKGQPTGKRRPPAGPPPSARLAVAPPLWRRILPFALLAALVLFILAWDFVSNQLGKETTFAVFWTSWNTHLRENVTVAGAGALWIVIFTFIVALMLALGETAGAANKAGEMALAAAVFAGLGLGLWLIYGLFQAGRLLPLPAAWPLESKARFVANHITYFYLFLGLLGGALAGVIFWLDPRPTQGWSRRNLAAAAAGAGLLLVALYVILTVNLNLVRADVFFKLGQSTDARQEWRSSLTFYDLATAMMPREDHYQLFQGRALLENARAATTAAEQDALLDRAEAVLLHARDLSPLNTDHTANLARYYGTRALTTNDPIQRTQALQQAADYYRQATTLSPNTAHLQNEWAAIYTQLGDYEKAAERFRRSLELDSGFVETYLRMAQMESQRQNWEAALADYEQGVKLAPKDLRALSGRAYALAKLGRLDEAIAANLEVLALAPTDVPTLQNVALLHQQLGQYQQALAFAQQARSVATADQQAALDALIQQIEQQATGAGGG